MEIRPASRTASHGFFDQFEVRQNQVLAVGILEFLKQPEAGHEEAAVSEAWENRELVGRHARLQRPWVNLRNNFALLGICGCGLLCVAIPLVQWTGDALKWPVNDSRECC